MHNSTALEVNSMPVGSTRNVSASFVGQLDDGELLTGTPTVIIAPTGPTLSDKRVNTSGVTISGERVLTGQAVLFQVTGVEADTEYTITITVSTNASQTLIGVATLNGE
jgi:hypothetical protein